MVGTPRFSGSDPCQNAPVLPRRLRRRGTTLARRNAAFFLRPDPPRDMVSRRVKTWSRGDGRSAGMDASAVRVEGERVEPLRWVAAWGVHLLTASSAPAGILAVLATWRGEGAGAVKSA